MPRDSGSNYTLPSSYKATTGQTIEAIQHNSPLEDLADAMTGSLARNGSGAMQADLPMAGFKITGLANGTAADEAVTKGQLDNVASVASTINAATDKATLNDDDRLAITDSAASYGIKRVLWSVIKSALSTVYAARSTTVTGAGLATGGGALDANQTITVTEATQAEAEAGTASTGVMTPRRVSQAIAALGGGSADVQTFTTSGTWTKPAGAQMVRIQLWGGGGGGGNTTGGGGGAYCELTVPASDLAATQAVVVGAGVLAFAAGLDTTFAGLRAGGGAAGITGGNSSSTTPGGTHNSVIGENGGQGITNSLPSSVQTYSGAGGGNGSTSLFGGNQNVAPGGGGLLSGPGRRGEARITTTF